MRSVKKILATALAFAMVTSVSVPVMAAEVPVAEEQVVVLAGDSAENPDEGIMPLASTYRYSVGPNWKQVAYNANGINGDLYLEVLDFNGLLHQVNIIMTDSTGKILWKEDNCTKTSNFRKFECGSNVCGVSIQIMPRWAFVDDQWYQVNITY